MATGAASFARSSCLRILSVISALSVVIISAVVPAAGILKRTADNADGADDEEREESGQFH